MLDLARVVLLATLSVAGASAAWAQPARGAAADGVRADAGSASISATDPTLAWTALSERAKALEAAPITIPNHTAAALGLVFVLILPAAVLAVGAVVVLLRRRR